MLTIALGVIVTSCGRQSSEPEQAAQATAPPAAGEFGRAVASGQPANNVRTFDALDFDVFSHQKWDRLKESHADDIVVSWPDGHETHGIKRHIEDLKKLFVHAPDTAITVHPIRIANGEWTAVTGVMTGTFTRPMPLPDGSSIQPTRHKFSLPMATFGHWKNGRMDHEWLYWDNTAYMTQLGM
ncbi:MAG TPA: ester cyclase [Allosphingosinicella sp.]|jgi:predicted ester cyclase|nr:ester cyclase [Allosphingosinicella sp.]